MGFLNCNIMRKLFKSIVFVAVAAIALGSCQKNEFDGVINKDLQFYINASIPETKTFIEYNGEDTYSPSWKNGDEIGIFFTEPTEKTEKVDASFSNTAVDGPEATFEGKATVTEDGTLYAFYPNSAFNQHYGDGTIRLDLSAAQKPTSTSFDPSCDILVAKPCDYLADGETVVIDDLYFARMMSVLKINLLGDFAQGEIVESLSFEVAEDADIDITGNAKVDYKNAEIKAWNNGSVKRNIVTATYTNEEYITVNGANKASYLVVAPVTIKAGTDLTFNIKTTNYNITKTVTVKEEKPLVFPAGNIAVINLTIEEENCESVDNSIDYSGVYLIAGCEEDKWFAAKKYVSGNYLTVTEIEFEGENILEADNISDSYMTLDKVEGGMYTILDAGGKYLSTSSSESNYMKAVSELSDNTYWRVEKNEEKGTYSIVASNSEYTKNDMRFNYNNGNPRVSCYDGTTTSQPYLTLFPVSLIKPDTRTIINVTSEKAKNIDAKGGDLTFNYTLKNLAAGDISVTVSDDEMMSTSVAPSGESFILTVTVSENTIEEQRSGVVTLAADGAESVNLTITQSAKPAEGGPVVVTDVLTREVTGVTSTTYTTWSGKTLNSEAIYAGQSAGGNNAIQLRTTNSNSGVVTTTSGGKVKKIKVTWQSSTSSGRTLDIYGKNTAYTAATDLYNSTNQGTKLGSIKYGTSTELEINGDYEYIGLRSNSGAMYLTEIDITWETSGSGDSGETPEPEPAPDPEQPGQGGSGEPTTVTMTSFSATSASMDSNVSYSTAKGGGTSAPAVNSNQIRLYQNSAGTGGGTITITAKDGYKLSSVTIGSSMATKVAYTIGTSTTKSTSASVSASGKYTVDDINATSITFYCMGTSSSSRLYVNYLSATYQAN